MFYQIPVLACWPAHLTCLVAAFWPNLSGSLVCIYSSSLDEDPLLSLISTRLATRQGHGTAAPGTPAALSPATPGSGPMPSSRRLQLPAAVQQWEVRWEELSVTRAIGRGSFGRVYLATWRETPVAVKAS